MHTHHSSTQSTISSVSAPVSLLQPTHQLNSRVRSLDGSRFKVGKWKIYSQSLDGEKLNSSDWILPKKIPTTTIDKSRSNLIVEEQKRTNILDVLNLETHADDQLLLSSSGRLQPRGLKMQPHSVVSHQSQEGELAQLQLGNRFYCPHTITVWMSYGAALYLIAMGSNQLYLRTSCMT